VFHQDNHPLAAVNEVHRATHAFDCLAADHPVGDIPQARHLHRAEDATSILPARIVAKLVAESKKLPPPATASCAVATVLSIPHSFMGWHTGSWAGTRVICALDCQPRDDIVSLD
jgi:hypothetical protein